MNMEFLETEKGKLFRNGYIYNEEYKGYVIAHHYEDVYTFYAIFKNEKLIDNYILTKRRAKIKITNLIKKGVK